MRPLLALCALAACRSHAPAPKAPPALDAILEKAVHDSHLVGLAAVIVDHGHVVLEKGYGFTDLDRKTPITADTVFEIGSLSKQFTAAAVLRLVDDGKLKLTDRVATYLPELAGDLTVQELMWQTSGLPEYAHGINLAKTPDELVHVIATMPPEFPHGTQWEYSNSNYFLLGRIVEAISKQPLADYLRDQVIARAKLTATKFCAPGTAQARPTKVAGDAAIAGTPPDVRFYGGAGAVCSTAHDLLRWQDALFGGKVLSPAGLAAMITPGKLTDGTAITYAGGLMADRVQTHPRIWHNGGVPDGYESQLDWYPDDKLQIVLLTNTVNIPPGATLGRLEHALAFEQLHLTIPKAVDLPMAADALAPYLGHFAVRGLGADVTVAGKHLHVKVAGGVDDDLLAQGGDRFVLATHQNVEYDFARAGSGAATRIDVYRDGTMLVTLTSAPTPAPSAP